MYLQKKKNKGVSIERISKGYVYHLKSLEAVWGFMKLSDHIRAKYKTDIKIEFNLQPASLVNRKVSEVSFWPPLQLMANEQVGGEHSKTWRRMM